jgi:hypothetical protein
VIELLDAQEADDNAAVLVRILRPNDPFDISWNQELGPSAGDRPVVRPGKCS